MRTICTEAKEKLGNCVMNDCDDDDDTPTFTLNNNFIEPTITTTATLPTISTYDTVQRPFKYDKKRGCWSTAQDFYFASTSHAFGSVVFSEIPIYAVLLGGVYFWPAYLIALLLYAVPIFLIQTFLGQFSTSGSISAFRVAPLFKGIGYSILILNFTSLTYYAVIAAVPLVYAIYSFKTVIPWMSCDNVWNTKNCTSQSVQDEEDDMDYPHATVEFFRHIIQTSDEAKTSEFPISWPVLFAVTFTWAMALLLLLRRVSFIGKFFRCSCILMLTIFIATFVYLLLHFRISFSMFTTYFKNDEFISTAAVLASVRAAIFMSSWLLGPGWGNVLTLASYNKFRHDSEKLTYRVAITFLILTVMAIIVGSMALDHFEDGVGLLHYQVEEDHHFQFLYLCFAFLFGSFTSLPNLWSFLFFLMLFLAELSAVIIQMMSILTAIFDEYEHLRTKKTQLTVFLVTILMLTSIYFCTKQGFDHLHVLPTINSLTHVIISIVLLIITTWIYGRERFQCDLQFMLGKTISNFKIFLIRFITPIFLVLNIFQILFFLERDNASSELLILTQSFVYMVAVGYMIYRMSQTNGSFRQRMKQCFKPHDWHPVDADNRRFYEEIMGVAEMLVIDNQNEQPQTSEA